MDPDMAFGDHLGLGNVMVLVVAHIRHVCTGLAEEQPWTPTRLQVAAQILAICVAFGGNMGHRH